MALYGEKEYVPVDVVVALKLDLREREMDIEPVRRHVDSHLVDAVISRTDRRDVGEDRPDTHRALAVLDFHFGYHQRLDRGQIQFRYTCAFENCSLEID